MALQAVPEDGGTKRVDETEGPRVPLSSSQTPNPPPSRLAPAPPSPPRAPSPSTPDAPLGPRARAFFFCRPSRARSLDSSFDRFSSFGGFRDISTFSRDPDFWISRLPARKNRSGRGCSRGGRRRERSWGFPSFMSRRSRARGCSRWACRNTKSTTSSRWSGTWGDVY